MFKQLAALVAGACVLGAMSSSAIAFDPRDPSAPARMASNDRQMGGGFIEFLFSGGAAGPAPAYPDYQPAPRYELMPGGREPQMDPRYQQQTLDPSRQSFDPKYAKQEVAYSGREAPGTIVIDTTDKFLYLVQGHGTALRYGVGVGRLGFVWQGVKQITAKREWPDWTPPAEMLQRRPDLPRHMEGGPENPLGARAMYLGSSLYRIHGSNEPWTIGTNVSSGCIRMRNEDVIDLYGRVSVGTRVVVL